jgi:FdhD protein
MRTPGEEIYHAAVLSNSRFDILSFSEDVGRHNAMDKTIGKLLLDGGLRDAAVLTLTSRMSYEMLQKAARAHLPIIISKSRPTALAAEMGRTLNMTLVCAPNAFELIIYCGEKRVIRK